MVDKEYGVVKDGFRIIFCITRIFRVGGGGSSIASGVECKKTEKGIGSFFMIKIGEELGAVVHLGVQFDLQELVGGGCYPLLKKM